MTQQTDDFELIASTPEVLLKALSLWWTAFQSAPQSNRAFAAGHQQWHGKKPAG